MTLMKSFITELIEDLTSDDIFEDLFKVDGDMQGIKIAASPINKLEVRQMIEQGHGIRILVGMDDMNDFMAVWVGESNSNTNQGAMHETIANQLGITGAYVPLERTIGGKLQITTTGQSFFDDSRVAEDALDRNREYRKVFSGQSVDYSKIGGW
jgi:hypothetical protein